MGIGQAGFKGDRLLIGANGIFCPPGLFQRAAQKPEKIGRTRRRCNGFFKMADGVFGAIRL